MAELITAARIPSGRLVGGKVMTHFKKGTQTSRHWNSHPMYIIHNNSSDSVGRADICIFCLRLFGVYLKSYLTLHFMGSELFFKDMKLMAAYFRIGRKSCQDGTL